jgi:hypothetical protein
MRLYRFMQNNSGGKFKAPALTLYVEAESAVKANREATEHGVYYDGVDNGLDCACCGDRWRKVDEFDAVAKVDDDHYPIDHRWARENKVGLYAIARADGRLEVVQPKEKE